MSTTPQPDRPARLEYLALLAMASALTAVWLDLWVEWTRGAWLGGAALPRLWPAGLAVLGLAASGLTDLALGQKTVPPRSARAALAGTGALAVFLISAWGIGGAAVAGILRGEPGLGARLGAALPTVLAALYAWWQGQTLGRSPLGNRALRATFNTGLLALAPLLFANSLLAVLSGEKLLAALLLFFGLGLSALALSSLRHLRLQQRACRLTTLALSRQWLATSSAVIGLVLGAGLLAARLAAPAALNRLAAALTGLLDQTLSGLGWILAPLAVLLDQLLAPALPALAAFMERFITALSLAIDRLRGLLALLVELVSLGGSHDAAGRRLAAFLASPAFQAGARWSGLILALSAAAIIFWLAARRWWGPLARDEDEQRESVLSGRLLLAQLRNLLNRRPRRRPSPPPDYLILSGAPDDARLIIRRAYQAMLEWARSLRLPRAAGQTPRAYAQMLAGAVPEGHDAIDLLTQAYVVARYAAEAPSIEHARRAEGAIARLKALHS